MNKPCVIQADFSTFRPVAGRKVLQLTFEVPIEQTRDVLEKLGVPTPGENRWCAIALLDLSNKPSEASAPSGSSNRKWNELALSNRAGIRCSEKQFQNFLEVANDDEAASRVRQICGIASRSDLNTNSAAAQAWEQLDENYERYLTDQRYGGSKHA